MQINDRIYAPYKIQGLVDSMSDYGFSAEEVLEGARITLEEIENPLVKSSIAQYLIACRNAVRLRPDPEFPFLIGRNTQLSAYGIYGYALMCSTTIRDVFDQTLKYHRLATPVVAMEWHERGGDAVWRFPQLIWPEQSEGLHHFLVSQQVLRFTTHVKAVAGPGHAPKCVRLTDTQFEHAALYSKHLACDISFGSPSCEVHYDAAILDHRTQFAHRLTSTLMKATCDRLVGEVKASTGVSGRVHQLLMSAPGESHSLVSIAHRVHMNERTLRRRLAAEETSFGSLLEDVRSTLAREYLRTTRMKTEDIATSLGFSDAANFRRAFKRWTGDTPRDYRKG